MKMETQIKNFEFSTSWIIGESDSEGLYQGCIRVRFTISAEFAEHKVAMLVKAPGILIEVIY
jgi:hypothetical protein